MRGLVGLDTLSFGSLPTMRVLATLVLLLAAGHAGHAQSGPATPDDRTRVYIEFVGNVAGASVNLERQVLTQGAIRVGIGAMVASDELNRFVIAAPVMVLRTPPGGRGFVLGAGVVPRYDVAGVIYRGDATSETSAGFAETFVTATVGYRWGTAGGGTYQVGFTPVCSPSAWNRRERRACVPLVGFSFGAGW